MLGPGAGLPARMGSEARASELSVIAAVTGCLRLYFAATFGRQRVSVLWIRSLRTAVPHLLAGGCRSTGKGNARRPDVLYQGTPNPCGKTTAATPSRFEALDARVITFSDAAPPGTPGSDVCVLRGSPVVNPRSYAAERFITRGILAAPALRLRKLHQGTTVYFERTAPVISSSAG